MKNRLNKVLKEQGRSKSWLANELGMNRSTIYKYCSNDLQPNIFLLKKLSKLLGISMEDLVE